MKKLFLIFWFLLLGVNVAEATTYWVKASGGTTTTNCADADGDSDPGVYIRTVQAGVACLAASDTLRIQNGVYPENVTAVPPSGTLAAPTTIEGESRTGAIIRPSTGRVWQLSVPSGQTRTHIKWRNMTLDGDLNEARVFVTFNGRFGNITLEDMDIINSGVQTNQGDAIAITCGGDGTGSDLGDWTLRGLLVHTANTGIYYQCPRALVENSEWHTITRNGILIQTNGFQQPGRHTIRRNIVHNTGTDPADTGNRAYSIIQPSDVYQNIAYNNTDNGFYTFGAFSDSVKFWNNTSYGNGRSGFFVAPNVVNAVLTNNLALGNATVGGSQISNNSGSTTLITNVTSGTASSIFIDPPSSGTDTVYDLSLKSTASTVINQGTAISGFAFNGSAPDIGAFETFPFASGTVTGNTMDLTFGMNLNVPLLPASGITGFTVNNSRNVTSATRLSDSVVRLTFDGAVCAIGETWNFSYSGGNVTDSALIGNSENQPLFSISNQSVTNQCTGSSPTKYASPGGSGSTCSSGSPCSLSTLLSQAAPGSTLILKGTGEGDGTYSCSGTCITLGAIDGTSAQPITLKAENPGLALIKGDGTAGEVLKFVSANWWIVEGLRVENVDNAAYTGSAASVVYIDSNSNDNIIRKNIVRNPNRWGNNLGIHVAGDRNLIEENDVLVCHRNCVQAFGTGATDNVFRLNYVGQTATNLAGSGQPNDGYVAYDSPNNRWESNIFESFSGADGGGQGFAAWAAGNKYYGNICIGAEGNCMVLASAASVTTGANNYVVQDQVNIGMQDYGLFLRSPITASVLGLTSHTSNAPNLGLVLTDQDNAGTTSATIRNAMLIDTTGAAASDIDTLTLSHSQEFGASSSWGTGTSGRTDSPPASPGDVDPDFGDCRVNVPSTSPFSGVGQAGADIGANAIWVYASGTRTSLRMFDDTLAGADRGKMLYGPAVISGVNDSSTGNVRSTVHQRIGFGTDSCAFPTGYSGSADPLVVHYKLDDGSGTTATDETANNNDGTLTDGPTWVTGHTGSAVYFGPNLQSYIATGYGSGINPSTQALFITEAVLPDSNALAGTYSVVGTPIGTNQRAQISSVGGTWAIGVQSSGPAANTEFPVQSGWQHLCVQFDPNTDTATLHVNGVAGTSAESVKSYTSYTLAGDFDIGRRSGVTNVLGFAVDDFKVRTEVGSCLDDYNAWNPPAPVVSSFTQVAYQFYLLRKDPAGNLIKLPTPSSSANTAVSVPSGAVLAFDLQTNCDDVADCDPLGQVLQFDVDGSNSWADVPASCIGEACFYGNSDTDPAILSGVPTCPLSGALVCVDGATVRTANAIPVFDLGQNQSVVNRYIVRIAAAAGKVLRFRVRNQDGNALGTYTEYPTVAVVGAYAGSAY